MTKASDPGALVVVAEDQETFVEAGLHAQVVVMESDAFAVVDPQAQHVAAGLVEGVVERRRTGNERRVDHAGEVSRRFSVGPFVDEVLPAFALHAEFVEVERFGSLGVDGPVQTAHRDRGQLPVLLFVEPVAGGQCDSAAERQQIFRKLFHGAFG